VTIWPRKHKGKTPSQAFTRSKQIYHIGRSLKFCGTVHGVWLGQLGLLLTFSKGFLEVLVIHTGLLLLVLVTIQMIVSVEQRQYNTYKVCRHYRRLTAWRLQIDFNDIMRLYRKPRTGINSRYAYIMCIFTGLHCSIWMFLHIYSSKLLDIVN